MPNQQKRHKIYVNHRVQGGVVLRLGAIWLSTTCLAILLSLVFQFFADPTRGFSYYVSNLGSTAWPLLIAFGATLPIAAIHLVRFTHRFVGPLVRLGREMRDLADGQSPPPLTFREKDAWHELAGDFNRVAKALAESQKRVAELEHQLAEREPVEVGAFTQSEL